METESPERTRVELRRLEALCRIALENGADVAGTLRYARELAGQHAAELTAALKGRAPRLTSPGPGLPHSPGTD